MPLKIILLIMTSIFSLWQRFGSPTDNFSIGELCLTGYYFHHVSRKNSKGGGVGLLLKKRIQIKKQTEEKYRSFEYVDVIAKCSNGCIRIVNIYRPPPSKSNSLNSSIFFHEFSTLAEQLVLTPGNLLIVGDFNYHVDVSTNSDATRFSNVIKSFIMRQHVIGPTHKHGHTLDLILTRSNDDLVTRVETKDPMLSDYLAVHFKLSLKKPPPVQTKIQYRKLRSININNNNNNNKISIAHIHYCSMRFTLWN